MSLTRLQTLGLFEAHCAGIKRLPWWRPARLAATHDGWASGTQAGLTGTPAIRGMRRQHRQPAGRVFFWALARGQPRAGEQLPGIASWLDLVLHARGARALPRWATKAALAVLRQGPKATGALAADWLMIRTQG